MNERFDQLEDVLKRAAECDSAGVFRCTRMPTPFSVELAGTRRTTLLKRWAPASLPIAASLALVMCLEGIQGPKSVNPSTHLVAPLVLTEKNCDSAEAIQFSLASFNSCITGPGEVVDSNDCVCADLDRDGDVDLLDFGILQRTATSFPAS